MKIDLIWIGKTQDQHVRDGIADLTKRVARYYQFSIEELKGTKNWSSVDDLKDQEGKMLLKKLESYDMVILFDERGKKMDSVQFSKIFEEFGLNSVKRVALVIGGAYGFSQEVYERSNRKISLSDMTFNHQLVRLMILEQLHRAGTISHNVPYHH